MTTGESLLLLVIGIIFVVGAFTVKSYSWGMIRRGAGGILNDDQADSFILRGSYGTRLGDRRNFVVGR